MIRYIINRLLLLPPMLLGIATILFLLTQMIPGDPLVGRFGMRIAQMSDTQIASLRAELGLDQPIYVQYWNYIVRLVQGDLGNSITSRSPVIDEILVRFPATLELALSTMLLVILLSIPLGITAALNRGRLLDNILMTTALVGFSMPSFWLGIMLMLLFSLQLGMLPPSGRGEGIIFQRMDHLILPAFTLALIFIGYNSRIVRSATLEIIEQDYVRTARSKGLRERYILARHIILNTLIPLITIMGVQFAGLLGGTVIIETIFAWPGIGRLAVNAVWRRDFPIIIGTTLFFSTFYIVINLIVDLLYVVIDPRIRL